MSASAGGAGEADMVLLSLCNLLATPCAVGCGALLPSFSGGAGEGVVMSLAWVATIDPGAWLLASLSTVERSA